MNRNTRDARIFVDELARAGLRHVVLAPGSRHTPLVLAFAEHPALVVHSHLDERSAGFYALGLALGTGQAVAVACTSGTAGANLFPAVIEAHQSRIPLLILTADRPHELRHSGANQTIDQVKLYGDYALWAVDAALPEADPPAVATRSLRTLAVRAMSVATGGASVVRRGVVHINWPFRKPLEPTPVPGDTLDVAPGAGPREPGPHTHIRPEALPALTNADADWLRDLVNRAERGLIVAAGPLDPAQAVHIGRAAAHIAYPLLAESTSNARHAHGGLGAYEMTLPGSPAPELILRFGDVPISNALNALLRDSGATVVHISPGGLWSDDAHITHQLVGASVESVCAVLGELPPRQSEWAQGFTARETAAWHTVAGALDTGPYFDGAALYDVVDLMPEGGTLFAGNSLPVRQLDAFGRPQARAMRIYANRGTSGIDGNISTALGLGRAFPESPLVAVLGDITFYHDMNGLLAVHRLGIPLTLVLLNNDGGGIFHRLPIRDYDPSFTDLFLTPHGLDFSHTAALYGLDYVRLDAESPTARADFRTALQQSIAGQAATIIELRTDARADLARRAEIMRLVQG